MTKKEKKKVHPVVDIMKTDTDCDSNFGMGLKSEEDIYHLPEPGEDEGSAFEEDDNTRFFKRHSKWLTLAFVVPKKGIFTMIVTFILNTLHCSLLIWIYTPQQLEIVHLYYVNYLIIVLTMFSYCWLQYSMNTRGVIEISQYEILNTSFVVRSIYLTPLLLLVMCGLFLSNDIFMLVTVYICLFLIIILPILFGLGLFPKLIYFLFYIMEYFEIFLFGGTASKNNSLTIVKFSSSVLVALSSFLVFFFLRDSLIVVCITLPFSLLFSLNFFAFNYKSVLTTFKRKYPSWVGTSLFLIFLGVSLVCLIALLTMGLLFYFFGIAIVSKFDSLIILIVSYVLEGIIIIVFCLNYSLGFFSKRFLCCNIIRNPIKCMGVTPTILKYSRKVLHYIAMCLILLYYFLEFSNYSGPTVLGLCFSSNFFNGGTCVALLLVQSIFILRAFKMVFHSFYVAGIEFIVVVLFDKVFIFQYVPFSIRLAIVGFCVIKAVDLYNLIHYIITFYVSIFTNKKLKFKRYKVILPISIIFLIFTFPIVVIFVVGLNFSFLPMLGIPIFVVTFPKVFKRWNKLSETKETSEKREIKVRENEDAIFYEFISTSLKPKLKNLFERGGVFDDCSHGDYFFLRNDPFIVIVQVISKSFENIVLSVKGMELQTTSCHSLEATYVDEEICNERNYSSSLVKENDKKKLNVINRNFFHILQPSIVINNVTCYSISKMKLVGIIDHPQTFDNLLVVLSKCLIWCALNEKGFKKESSLFEENEKTEKEITPVESTPVIQNDGLEEIKKENDTMSIIDQIMGKLTNNMKQISSNSSDVKSTSTQKRIKKDEKDDVFPHEWYEFTSKKKKEKSKITKEDVEYFVEKCLELVFPNSKYENSYKIEISLIHEIFNQTFDVEECDINNVNVFTKAFMFAIKMIMDSVIFFDVEFLENNEEFLSKLNELNDKWVFGANEMNRGSNFVNKKGSFCNIVRDKEDKLIYRMIIYTLKNDSEFYVGSLNREAVKAILNNLNFEMLYVTNDDDERFSIQANELLLNNIIIQSADSPFGYPIFNREVNINVL